jgi:hypothetical protein
LALRGDRLEDFAMGREVLAREIEQLLLFQHAEIGGDDVKANGFHRPLQGPIGALDEASGAPDVVAGLAEIKHQLAQRRLLLDSVLIGVFRRCART